MTQTNHSLDLTWDTSSREASAFRESGNPQLCIAIEGNIAAGKSTILQQLAQMPKITVFPEPLEEWQGKLDGFNHLQLMYAQPTLYSSSMQTKVMITNYKRMHQYCPTPIAIYERSVGSANIFRPHAQQVGNIPASTAAVLEELDNLLQGAPIDHYLYIDTDPVTCLKRVALRQRRGEEFISLEYLTNIENLHYQWIQDQIQASCTIVDGHQDIKKQLDFVNVYISETPK